jgi:vitamin K-dependent gamma-carboxylase-like protein
VKTLADYARDWASDVIDGWNRFWFTPADAATLALIRIFAGAMLFYTHLVWSLGLTDFFGASGWLSAEAVKTLQRDTYAWSYLWLLKTPVALWGAHVAGLVVLALLTAGLFTRITSVLAWLVALAYVHRAPGSLFGLDQINVMLAMYLMIGASGDAFSIDRWRQRRGAGEGPAAVPPRVSTNIAVRLIQLHMCIIYLFAGTAKLTGPAWWNGTAMWNAFGNLEYQSLDMTWLHSHPWLVNLMTHVTVFWELYYCALIWPRRLRPLMLALAVPLHLGIALCLGMMTFGLAMLIGNLAFVSPVVVRAILNRRPPATPSNESRAGERAKKSTTRS